MRIKINKNLVGIHTKLSKMTDQGQIAFVNQVYADTQKFVPMLSGDLRNQSSIAIDKKSITWNTPYARRQYYNVGANFTTPGTYAKWDEIAKAMHKASWQNVVRKAMK